MIRTQPHTVICLERYRHNSEAAHGLKACDPEAVAWCAEKLAGLLPSNLPLVPVPGRTGRAGHTLLLARAISRIAGNPVLDILRGNPRESLYALRYRGVAPDLQDFRLWATARPTRCVLLDNVVATGFTVAQACKALGAHHPCACFASVN